MRVPEPIHKLAWSLASIAVVVPAGATGQPQGGGEPDGGTAVLRQASLHVTADAPLAARVEAGFEIAGDGDLELLLTRLPGQTLSELRVEFDGEAVETAAGGTGDAGMRRLRLPLDGGTASLSIGYSVRKAPGTPFRFPLVVPAAAPVGDARSVRLVVDLPPGAEWAGDSFPRFDRVETGDGGTRLEARLIGVPALAYVAFASGEAPRRLDLILEVSALALVAAVLGWWAWRRHRARVARAGQSRRSAGANEGGPGRGRRHADDDRGASHG